ncbi:MAG: hypothetical protein EXR83_14505 [Gammaproteobacteria bacterium]|nr:hypothetical protein [Gammaproteobacteria bacterium]
MHCIPVLDIAAGGVVRAVRGERAAYRPLTSCLTQSTVPADVVAALRGHFASTIFYVADLDAIQQHGSNHAVIRALVAAHPDCEWWIDAGFDSPTQLAEWAHCPNVRCVIGSESLHSLHHYATLCAALPAAAAANSVLSLDRKGATRLGPADLWTTPARWPQHLIAMNLAKVGASEGPDFDYLHALRALAPNAALVAAGGARHAHDLARLRAQGIAALLLATALHDGSLCAADVLAQT